MKEAEFSEKLRRRLREEAIYHFTPEEICPVGRVANGAKLKPASPSLFGDAVLTLHRLEQLRARVREVVPGAVLRVNSGYRDPAYNKAIGGSPGSMHMEFNAIDFSAWVKRSGGQYEPAMSPLALANILESFPDSDRFGIGVYETFVHFDTRGYLGYTAPARW